MSLDDVLAQKGLDPSGANTGGGQPASPTREQPTGQPGRGSLAALSGQSRPQSATRRPRAPSITRTGPRGRTRVGVLSLILYGIVLADILLAVIALKV
jgi:hypothetical protein